MSECFSNADSAAAVARVEPIVNPDGVDMLEVWHARVAIATDMLLQWSKDNGKLVKRITVIPPTRPCDYVKGVRV